MDGLRFPENLRDVLLVGSIPFDSAHEAMRQAAAVLRDSVGFIPDGETDGRRRWTGYLPRHAFASNPQLQEVRRPRGQDFVAPPRDEQNEGGRAMADTDESVWHFSIRDRSAPLDLGDLGYSGPAIESYRVFRQLRDQAAIPAGTRFQVALPGSAGGVDQYFGDAADWPDARRSYEAGIRAEIAAILEAVPASDLAIQFDLAGEVTDLANGDVAPFSWAPPETWDERFERHVRSAAELTRDMPDEVLLGVHLCYGTWGGWPMVAMHDLQLCVALANAIIPRSHHHVDYVHMPVTRDAGERFFAPLAKLAVPGTKLYLGLVHDADTAEEFGGRARLARVAQQDFGIAAVCGFGRTDPARLPALLADHARDAGILRDLLTV
jgi:hypothetical protein